MTIITFQFIIIVAIRLPYKERSIKSPLLLCPLLLLMCSPIFAAEFYQCKDEKGRAVFTQTPCSDDSKVYFVNEPNRKSEATLTRLANEKKKEEISQKLIPEQYRKIMSLRSERDDTLNQVGISLAERKKITASYEQKIDLARAKVKDLELQRDSL